MLKLGSGDFDLVYRIDYHGTDAVLKCFNPKDQYRGERYLREKFLFSRLSPEKLSPELLDFDDVQYKLVIAYYPNNDLRDKRSLFDRIPSIMTAAHSLHSIKRDEFPPYFRISSLTDSTKRKEALLRSIQMSEIPVSVLSAYSDAIEALQEYVGQSCFHCTKPQLVHGDLHPFNALEAWDNTTRFIDFGRSRFADPAFDLGHFTYRITNGYYLDFSQEEIHKWFENVCKNYPDNSVADRARMYYHFWLGFDLNWVGKEWALFDPSKKEITQKIALTNLEKIAKAYANHFQLGT